MNGLVYVAFGSEYDKLAAHTITYSRHFTDLPICVLTNIVDRHPKWREVQGVEFRYFSLNISENRDVKTRMIEYSPFDISLYLDCDSVIQKKGIEEVFSLVHDEDLLLNTYLTWKIGDQVLQLYKKVMKQTGTSLPMVVYNGGFIIFKKNDQVQKFFELWNKYWNISGRGREMPALSCAVKNSGISVKGISLIKEKVFSPGGRNSEVVVQHNYGRDFCDLFGLPQWQPYKPFDKDPRDWDWVDF